MLSGLVVVMSPVMGDAINVELPGTAEITDTAQYFADFILVLYLPLVWLASFSNLGLFLSPGSGSADQLHLKLQKSQSVVLWEILNVAKKAL